MNTLHNVIVGNDHSGLYIDVNHQPNSIMDVVINSKGQDPSEFVARFDQPLNLDKKYEVAVKSIYYGSAYNIPPNKYSFRVVTETGGRGYYIEPGYYSSLCEILVEIYRVMKEREDTFISGHPDPPAAPSLTTSFKTRKTTLEFESNVNQSFELLPNKDQDLLRLFGYTGANLDNQFKELSASFDDKVPNSVETGYIYSTIVSNMSVNNDQSRMLTTFPVESKECNNYYEFNNPTYRPVAVKTKSLLDMEFKLTDAYGRKIVLDPSGGRHPTTIVLNFREITV